MTVLESSHPVSVVESKWANSPSVTLRPASPFIMKALAATAFGSDFATLLNLQDIPMPPEPLPHQVLIRIIWSDVNPVDLQKLKGRPGQAVDGFFVPGFAGSGIVEKQGDSLSTWKKGSRVVFLLNPTDGLGSYAEYCLADHRAVALIPDSVSLRDAACVPLAGCTAYEALYKLQLHPEVVQRTTNKKEQKRLLVIGGSGGVGSWATRLARYWHSTESLEIIATTSSVESSSNWCQEQGASKCVHHTEIDQALQGGPKGSVDAILCLTEPTTNLFKAMSEVLKPNGHMCLVVAGNSIATMDLGFLFFKSAHLSFETVFSSFRSGFTSFSPGKEMEELLQLVAKEGPPLSPLMKDIKCDLIHAAEQEESILAQLQGGHARGKMVIRISELET